MAPLTANRHREGSTHTPNLTPLPVKAGVKIFSSAYVCSDALGLAVPASDTAGLTPHGVALKGFDNSSGADGVIPAAAFGAQRFVEVDGAGQWELAVSAGVPRPGAKAFIVDDNTVSAAATANNLVAGTFTRPGFRAGTWLVDVSRR